MGEIREDVSDNTSATARPAKGATSSASVWHIRPIPKTSPRRKGENLVDLFYPADVDERDW